MNRFRATELAACVASLHAVACRCAKDEVVKGKGVPADQNTLVQANHALKSIEMLARTLHLGRCRRVAATAAHHIGTDENTDVTTIKVLMIGVVNDIHRDLGELAFLFVQKERSKFIDHEPHFDIDQPGEQRSVHEAFPNARFDAREAGNCLAADCNTAAVFHMMRVVEWGLRALCVDLGMRRLRCINKRTGKVTYKPLEYSEWDSILSQLRARTTDKLARLSRGQRKQALQEFYLPAIQDVEAFKDAFRNHVMHSRREYTRKEADAIRDRVQRFMRLLATRVSEV